MICIVDENNKIINIVDSPYPSNSDEHPYYPWNKLWDNYINVEPVEFANQREAQEMQDKLKQKAIDSIMLILNGSSEMAPLQEEYQTELESVSDDVALYMADMFPTWNSNGVEYREGKRIYYEGILYKVLTTHTSQESWKPDVSPSLFVKVISSISGEIPEWQQPSADNAYQKGDRVRFNGRIYESIFEGDNVWSPEAYPAAWKDITDEIGEAQ